MFTPALGTPVEIDTKGLNAVEVEALTKLLSQGACPCDKKKSILTCATDQSCPAAKELAVFGAEKFREGLSALDVQRAVVKKYIQDHVHYTFDLKGAPVKGPVDAKITVVEFADFQCGHCARLSESIKVLQAEFGDRVRFVFKQFPMTRHPFAHYAARASLAAHRQGAFWQFHDLLFKHQLELSEAKIDGFASELNLDLEKYNVDRERPETYEHIARDRKEAIAAGLRATPTLYMNGRLYTESKRLDALRKNLQNALRAN